MSARFRKRKMKKRSRLSKRRMASNNSLPYEILEARVVLTADFGFADGILTLDDFAAASHDVTIAQGVDATEMTFTLAAGTWSGVNSAEATGDGTDTLTVEGLLVDQVVPLTINPSPSAEIAAD